MIPKVIHYCWFGHNDLPELAKKCIASWKKYLPDYTIQEWNEDNFNVNIIRYTQDAYLNKKYAFVSDYARFWILYNYGGIYFDTDVEIIKCMDDIISKGAFMGCETDYEPKEGRNISVAPGLCLGVEPHHYFYSKLLSIYSNLNFINNNGTYNLKTVVEITTEALLEYGLKNEKGIQTCADIIIYPKEYFCPKDFNGFLNITSNTVSIHHYDGSWQSEELKYMKLLREKIGNSLFKRRICVFVAALKYRGLKAALCDIFLFIRKKL